MKYLGIDFGEKRVGVAISDEARDFAFPYQTIKNSPTLVKEIVDICAKEGIVEIVVGESNNYKGVANPIMVKTNEFVKELAALTKLPVKLEPEFMTSFQAARVQGEHKLLDASAAALILQSFLERRKNGVV